MLSSLQMIVCARVARLVRSPTANQEVPNPGLIEGWTLGDLSFATLSVDMDVKPLV